MGERISDEVYECAGCAGEVPVVDAVWLPEPRPFEVDASKARPYCCRECFEAHQKALAAQRRAEELKNEARRVASSLVVLSGTDCIGIGSYEPGIATIVQLDADGVKRRARTAESWQAYIADALVKFAQQHVAALAAQERADADLRGEADDMAYRFGCLLDHATGARLSKTNYPKEVMYNAVNEYVQRCCDKAVREAREEWEAEKPTSAPGGGEGPFSSAEALARFFHDTYERLAPSFGYETRPETRTFDPTSKNGRLMVAVAGEILARRHRLAQVAPATAIGTTVREDVVSELSRAIDLIDHEDQAATREARDLLIRLKALLSAPADGVVCKNLMPSGRRACDALPLEGCPCNDPASGEEVRRGE